MKTWTVSQQEKTRTGNIWVMVGTHRAKSRVDAVRMQYPDASEVFEGRIPNLLRVETGGRGGITMEVLCMEGLR